MAPCRQKFDLLPLIKITITIYHYNLGKLANVCHDRKVKTKEKAPSISHWSGRSSTLRAVKTQNEDRSAADKPRLLPP